MNCEDNFLLDAEREYRREIEADGESRIEQMHEFMHSILPRTPVRFQWNQDVISVLASEWRLDQAEAAQVMSDKAILIASCGNLDLHPLAAAIKLMV